LAAALRAVDNCPVTPERNLGRLLAAIAPRRHEGVWVFCDVPSGCLPEGIEPRLTFVEGDTTTVVLAEEQARAAGLPGVLPSVWISLEVDSDLAAVGFLAVITARLAAASISVNVVSAYRHDHLFVPLDRADDAMEVLTSLQAEAERRLALFGAGKQPDYGRDDLVFLEHWLAPGPKGGRARGS